MTEQIRIAVLVSGRGSNMEALVRQCVAGTVPGRVVLVVSDNPGAQALKRAEAYNIEAKALDPKDFADKENFFAGVTTVIEAAGAQLVVLAGFMRLLPASFVRRFKGRIMNIHPSLLPAFPGLHAQRQAVDYGVKMSGCTVHFVDEGMDTGPIILQRSVPVLAEDDEENLATRILAEEHIAYPDAVRLFAEGRLQTKGRKVFIQKGEETDD